MPLLSIVTKMHHPEIILVIWKDETRREILFLATVFDIIFSITNTMKL